MAQMGLIRYRSTRIRFYLLKAGPQADDEPLPPGAPGLPRRSDFWIMLVIAVAVFAIILYASTRLGRAADKRYRRRRRAWPQDAGSARAR